MVDVDNATSQSLWASGILREKPSSRKNICQIRCAICDEFTKNKIYDKHILKVDSRVENFLKISDVYNRVSDSQSYTDCMVQIYITKVHA